MNNEFRMNSSNKSRFDRGEVRSSLRQLADRTIVQIVLIVLLTTLAYVNIFKNTLVIDDQYFIQEWQVTRSWSNAGQMILGANPDSQQGVYRPIRSLLYLVYYQVWGTNPIGYHLHSLAIHLASTVLVFFILRHLSTLSHLRDLGFPGALLFGLHPIHTESITYIAASMEMTGVVFMLGSFWLYMLSSPRTLASLSRSGRGSSEEKAWIPGPFQGKQARNDKGMILFFFSVLFALLAFFTYEMTLTLPLLLLLYELTLGQSVTEPCPRGPLWQVVSTLQNAMKNIWPYFVAAGVFLAIRFSLGVGLSRGDYLAYSFYHTQLVMTQMWVKYIAMLFFPVTLSHNHTILPGFEAFMTPYSDLNVILRQSILDPQILFSIGVIGGVGWIGWKLRKKMPLISFAIGWFFIALLPVAYFFPQGTAFSEKYLYIASFGFVFFVGWILGKFGKIGVIGVILISLLYGLQTYMRNQNWQSPRVLWEYEARTHPQSELVWYTLGVIYGKNGETDRAISAYQTALSLKPQMKEAELNLNNLLKLQKHTP